MPVYPIVGIPGALTPIRTTFRRVFEGSGAYLSLPGGATINGSGADVQAQDVASAPAMLYLSHVAVTA